MSKEKITEDFLKQLGVRIAPDDDPIYSRGPGVHFVKPGSPSTPAEPETTTTSTAEEKPASTGSALANPFDKPSPEGLGFYAWVQWLALAAQGNFRASILKLLLKKASQDGHDWRKVYAAVKESRPPQWKPLPPEEQVDPSQ